MANIRGRNIVRALRSKGKSIKVISKLTGTSTSTVSHWCRDIRLTEAQIKKLAAKRAEGGMLGRLRAAEKKREQRILATAIEEKKGAHDINSLSRRDIFMLGLGLYWGEGYKSGNEECGLTNSDPYIVRTYMRWLSQEYGVRTEDLIARVSINAIHKNKISKIEKFWSEFTKIPISQFTTASFISAPVRKEYSDTCDYHGTLRVKVRRATNIRRRILGSIKELRTRIK